MPWSPLENGVLSGKYTRKVAGQAKSDRGVFVEMFLNDKTYALIDELQAIAAAHDSTVARVALAWLSGRPGVASPIIGARRLSQLEDNLAALDLSLTPEERAHLDALTRPAFTFPQSMQPIFTAVHHGGTKINGVEPAHLPFLLGNDGKPLLPFVFGKDDKAY